jgi:Domain of Unknown Function (DUF1080)
MRIRRTWFALLLALIAATFSSSPISVMAAEPNTLSPEEIADGWILLFDGETLFGWTAGSDANWKAHDGIISVTDGKGGLLCTNTEFADYQLHVDFRSPADTNSGVFLRTALKPKSVKTDCYELNIAPESNPFPTGGFVQRQRAENAKPKPDEWNTYDLTAEGGHFVVKLNGQQVLDYTDPKPIVRGLIGLQRNEGPADFRNIKLRPLGLKSLFNGHDLTGWKMPEGSKSVCTVTPEGWINVKNGSGCLESDGQFGDFVLQLEAISNLKNSNSGVFFRSIPGEKMNGYECQLQNGFKNGDRTQPSDGGTGAIYRRQPARKVVPNDMEWFSETLIATGKHMACWINGYQVSDVVDNREPNKNPREGSRTAAGTLQLQGHDAKTDASFRNLRAVELPAAVAE